MVRFHSGRLLQGRGDMQANGGPNVIRTGTPPEPDFVEDTKSNPQIEYEVVSMEVSQKALCSSGDRYYHAELGGWKEEDMDAMGEALVDKGP